MSRRRNPAPSAEPWFSIRRDLSAKRRTILTGCSFIAPLFLWCVVSYVPFIWHPDVKLQVSADRAGVSTVYTAGDHVGRDFFPIFVEAVRAENAAIRRTRETFAGDPGSSRQNKKTLRHLAPLAVAHGWLAESQTEDDAAIYDIWRKLATGILAASRPPLSDENLAIVRTNWETLASSSPAYDSTRFPREPLLKLVPQGRPANPVYLPAPHEVVTTGVRDFLRPPADGQPSMRVRLLHSVRVVFGGFLLACLLGVPIGILSGTYDFFSKLFEPFIDFFRYMPAPAFSTLLVAIFMAHDAPKVALIFIGTYFQLVLVVAKTTRLLDPALLEAAQTLGANRRQLVTRVIIPGILPNLYNDLRILLGWAWTWLVIAELIGVKSGLTEFIETQGRWRNFDRVFPVIIMIGLLGFFTDQVLSWLRGILFPWTGEGGGGNRLGVPQAFAAALRALVPACVAKPAIAPAAPGMAVAAKPSASLSRGAAEEDGTASR